MENNFNVEIDRIVAVASEALQLVKALLLDPGSVVSQPCVVIVKLWSQRVL